jgi:hypothetical protein
MSMQLQALEEALSSLGAVLEQRRTPYNVVVVGGGWLLLLGLMLRPTADLDVIALAKDGEFFKLDHLPAPLAEAATQVAQALELADNWLNTGPSSLMDLGLPQGWTDRLTVRTYGWLQVHVPSRFDQICFKLYAAVDRGPDDKHYADLLALHPTHEELLEAARWTITHDPSEGFRSGLVGCLASMGLEVEDADFD